MATPPSAPGPKNLEIAMQLAAVLNEVTNKLHEQVELYKQQVQLVEAICKGQECFGEMDSAKLQEISNSIKEATQNMDVFGKQTAMAAEQQGKLGELVKKASEWANKLSVPQEFLNGFKAGFNLSTGLFKQITSLGGTAFGLIKNIGMTLLSLPGKFMDFFQNAASGGSDPLREALEEVRDAYGNLQIGTSEAIVGMTKDMKGFSESAGVSFGRVFGHGRQGLATLMRENLELAKGMGPVFNQMISTVDTASPLLTILRKSTSLSAEAYKTLAINAQAAGKTAQSAFSELSIKLVQASRTFGISTKEMSIDLNEILKNTSTFGKMAPDVMIKTSAYVRKLGISIETLKKVMDKSLNFEDAAQQAASLSEAFNMNLDAMKLMKEQDPTKKLDMIRESFFRTGRSVEQLSLQEMKALQNATNLSDEELRLAFAQKNRNMTQAQLADQMKKDQKHQVTEAEAMQELSKSIKQLVQSGSPLKGSFFKVFMDGFEQGIMRSREFRRVVRNLQRSMYVVLHAGRQVGRMFVDMFPGIRDILGGLGDMFDPSRFRNLMRKVIETFRDFFKMLQTDPEAGFKSFMEKMKKNFIEFFNSGSPAGSRVLNGFVQFFKAAGTIFIQGLKYGLQAIVEALKGITGYLKDPSSLVAVANEAGGGIKTTFVNAFRYAVKELGPVMKEVGSAFVSLIKTLVDLYIKPHIGKILLGIFAFFFGPAIVMGLVRGLFSAALQGGIAGIRAAMSNSRRAIAGASDSAGSEEVTAATTVEKVQKAAEALKQMRGALFTFTLAISGIILAIIILAAIAQAAKVKPESMLMITATFAAVALLINYMLKSGFFDNLVTFGGTLDKNANAAKQIGSGILAIGAIMISMAAIVALAAAILESVDSKSIAITLLVFGAISLIMYGIVLTIPALAAAGAALQGPQIAAVLIGLLAVGVLMAGIAYFAKESVVRFVAAMRSNRIDNETVKTVTEVIGAFTSMIVQISLVMGLLTAALAVSGPLMIIALPALVAVFFALRGIIREMTKSILEIISSLSALRGDPSILREKANIFKTISEGLGALLQPIVELLGDISDDFFASGSANAAAKAGYMIIGVIKTLADKDTGVIPPLLKQIDDMSKSTTTDPARLKAFAEIFSTVAKGIADIIGSVASVLKTFDSGLILSPAALFGQAASMQAKFEALKEIISGLLPAIQRVLTSLMRDMVALTSSITNVEALKALGPILTSVSQIISGILNGVSGFLNDSSTGGALNSLSDLINARSASVVQQDKLIALQNFIGDFSGSLRRLLVGMDGKGGIIGGLKNLVDALPSDATKIKGLEAIGNIINSMTSIIVPIIESVANLTKNIKAEKGLSSDQINSVGTGISSVIGSLTTSFGSMFDQIPILIGKLSAINIPQNLTTQVKAIQGVFDLIKNIGSIISTFRVPAGGGSTRNLNMWEEVFVPIISLLAYFVVPSGQQVPGVRDAVGHRDSFKAILDGLVSFKFPPGMKGKIETLKSLFETIKIVSDATKSLKDLAGEGSTRLSPTVLDVPLMNLATVLRGINSRITSDGKINPLKDPSIFDGLADVNQNLRGKDSLVKGIKDKIAGIFQAISDINTATLPEDVYTNLVAKLTTATNIYNQLNSYFIGGNSNLTLLNSQIQNSLSGPMIENVRGMVSAYNQFVAELKVLEEIPSIDMVLQTAGQRLTADRNLRIERGTFNMQMQINIQIDAGDITKALYRFNKVNQNSGKPENFKPGTFNAEKVR